MLNLTDIKNRSIEPERMKRKANKRPISKNFTLKFPKIIEDFEKIQKINSNIIQLTAVKSSINYAAVSRFAAEINHRAVRLKSNLFSSELKEKKAAKYKQQNIGNRLI